MDMIVFIFLCLALLFSIDSIYFWLNVRHGYTLFLILIVILALISIFILLSFFINSAAALIIMIVIIAIFYAITMANAKEMEEDDET